MMSMIRVRGRRSEGRVRASPALPGRLAPTGPLHRRGPGPRAQAAQAGAQRTLLVRQR
jgi:hypothetical protein